MSGMRTGLSRVRNYRLCSANDYERRPHGGVGAVVLSAIVHKFNHGAPQGFRASGPLIGL